MSVNISFEGWFQCRLATDPDDFDHPRGDSGWTSALPGKLDLDRIIRMHDPINERSHGPNIGVVATRVEVGGNVLTNSPLLGSDVHLLDDAVFEGRNGSIASSADEPIAPFHLNISSGGISLDGFDPIDLVNATEVERRKPVRFLSDSQLVIQKTGIVDPAAYRLARRLLLENDLVQTIDPNEREGIEQRIDELGLGSIREESLGFQLDYSFELRGPNALQDSDDLLGLEGQSSDDLRWSVEFWMGAWDADTLCGFVDGRLRIEIL